MGRALETLRLRASHAPALGAFFPLLARPLSLRLSRWVPAAFRTRAWLALSPPSYRAVTAW